MKSLIKPSTIILMLAALSSISAHAAAPMGKQITGAVVLQGGSDSAVIWSAPNSFANKVHVFVPKSGIATNALYRVYPKGKRTGSANCVSTDLKFPCYEITVDQTQHQNSWAQLMLNNDAATQWDFVKSKGYVTAVANNLSAAEMLNLSVLVRFENQTIVIGKTYQGGIVFYIDGTGEHGLVAALTDQSSGIQWYNGSFITTGATGTAVGTGLANTNKIIITQGKGEYAANLCTDLVVSQYSDWYLPSIDELNLMYRNIGQGATAPLTNVGGFAYNGYWSSSERVDYSGAAWYINFNASSTPNGATKTYPNSVRAVRMF